MLMERSLDGSWSRNRPFGPDRDARRRMRKPGCLTRIFGASGAHGDTSDSPGRSDQSRDQCWFCPSKALST